MAIKLNMFQTLAAAIVVFYIGVILKKHIKFFDRYCIPSPVIGGIVFAILNCVFYVYGIWTYDQDGVMQGFFMTLFFTSIGYTASLKILKEGGFMVAKMVVIVTVLIILQDLMGSSLAKAFGLNPLLGLATGSIPMVGGHGTSGAFGPVLESVGLADATTIAFAAATFGLVSGSLIGGPVAERLIRKYHLVSDAFMERMDEGINKNKVEALQEAANGKAEDAIKEELTQGVSIDENRFMNALGHLLLAMGIGTIVSAGFVKLGVVFPSYIGSMLVAAVIRNISDSTHAFEIYQRESEVLGTLGLNIFLSLALMSMKLWQLFDLAIPLIVLLMSQAIMMALFATFVTFRFMGHDYEAAVMASGNCGFGLGATPNAIANMKAITERFGPAPTAFFVIPLVGALLVDFVNASIITVFINFLK